MGVTVDRREFAMQLALRGLRQQDLALLAGLSEAVVSAAARGRPISGPTFGRIAAALAAAPVVAPEADRLLAGTTSSPKPIGGRPG
jgi:hypothetical protein